MSDNVDDQEMNFAEGETETSQASKAKGAGPGIARILMVVGIVGLVASGIVFAASRQPIGSGKRTYDRQATNAQGQSTEVHEEVHS